MHYKIFTRRKINKSSYLSQTLSSEQQIAHVQDIRQAVRFAVSDLKGQELLPGFCLPKGITPILPIFREAILNGLPEAKEHAAQGLGEVIRLSSAAALQPSVVHITGPLIRILGDRFNWSVKAAVLETLAILLGKVFIIYNIYIYIQFYHAYTSFNLIQISRRTSNFTEKRRLYGSKFYTYNILCINVPCSSTGWRYAETILAAIANDFLESVE